jgi:hypothetical protein
LTLLKKASCAEPAITAMSAACDAVPAATTAAAINDAQMRFVPFMRLLLLPITGGSPDG